MSGIATPRFLPGILAVFGAASLAFVALPADSSPPPAPQARGDPIVQSLQ
jgi:hypothetical protein